MQSHPCNWQWRVTHRCEMARSISHGARGFRPTRFLQTLPAQQEILSAYLDYLDATGRIDAAGGTWNRLLASPEPINFDAASRYFDALLYAHRVDALAPVWAALARHDPDQVRYGSPEAITGSQAADLKSLQ